MSISYKGVRIPVLSELDCSQKTVLLRVDFNVPLNPSGQVEDATRIRAALPTIQELIKQDAKVVLISHLGRPKGQPNERYSLAPVASVLAKELERPVVFIEQPLEASTRTSIESQPPGTVILLENLRFHSGEEANDKEFVRRFADLADVFVNDAFGTVHRAHASTDALPRCFDSKSKAAGLLIEKELAYFLGHLSQPEPPFAVVLGGAKVSDKITVINRLLEKANMLFIGGAMAYTFALAQGRAVGKSLCEVDCVPLAQEVIEKAKKLNVELFLPKDIVVTDVLDFKTRKIGAAQILKGDIPEGWEGVDIGPETLRLYSENLKRAKTILWNGPMGVFEVEACSGGTLGMAIAIQEAKALSIVGGGDSVSAAHQSGCSFSFISTGGGASLALLEDQELPGLLALG